MVLYWLSKGSLRKCRGQPVTVPPGPFRKPGPRKIGDTVVDGKKSGDHQLI